MKNILLLHNGNNAVKDWIYKKYPNHAIMPCFLVDWPIDKDQSIKTRNNIICDITSADQIGYIDLVELKKYFYIIKVLSTHSCDLDNLEDTWDINTYDYTQWLQATLVRLCVADHIFYYNDEEFVLPSGNEEEIIFSPGRCGTHVLKEVVNVQKFCHHDGQFVTSPNLNKTIDSKKIFVIIRRNFFKFTISHFARNTVGKVMLTWANNFNENKKIIDQINSLTITENDFLHELNTMSTFLDIILGFNFLWKKEISLCYFEDLSSHFDKVKIMKNPYDTKDIVDNYDQAIDLGNKYQPIYDSLLQQVNLIFKLAQL